MKKYSYILASMFIAATALVGCSSDDDTTPAPTPTPVPDISETVDLALPSGNIWAGYNVGASKVYEKGNLYAWGETATKTSYSLSNYFDPSFAVTQIAGNADYDVATLLMGDAWQTPDTTDFRELIDNCSLAYYRYYYNDGKDSVDMIKVTGKNDHVLYLPYVAGKVAPTVTSSAVASYWTSTINSESCYAQQFIATAKKNNSSTSLLDPSAVDIDYRSRFVGSAVRPVQHSQMGSKLSDYYDIKGAWAKCDASGNISGDAYISFDGTEYSGDVVVVSTGISAEKGTYIQYVDRSLSVAGDTAVVNAVILTKDANADTLAVKLQNDIMTMTNTAGSVTYFKKYTEPANMDLTGKWEFTYNNIAYKMVLSSSGTGTITDGTNTTTVTSTVNRFGTLEMTQTPATVIPVATITQVDAKNFKLNVNGTFVNVTRQNITYIKFLDWTASETFVDATTGAPSFATIDGSNVKMAKCDNVTDAEGNNYKGLAAISTTKGNSSPTAAQLLKIVYNGQTDDASGFVGGDLISATGYVKNATTSGLCVYGDFTDEKGNKVTFTKLGDTENKFVGIASPAGEQASEITFELPTSVDGVKVKKYTAIYLGRNVAKSPIIIKLSVAAAQ